MLPFIGLLMERLIRSATKVVGTCLVESCIVSSSTSYAVSALSVIIITLNRLLVLVVVLINLWLASGDGPSSANIIWVLVFTCGSNLGVIHIGVRWCSLLLLLEWRGQAAIFLVLLGHLGFHEGSGHALVFW